MENKKNISTNINMNQKAEPKAHEKRQFFLKELSMYLKDAKRLGYHWIDLVKKSTRQNVINEVINYRFNKKIQDIENEKTKDRELDQKLDHIMTKHDKIINKPIFKFPMIDMSVQSSRINEMRLSSDKDRNKLSFISLFERRLDNMQRDTSISLTIDIVLNRPSGEQINKYYGPIETLIPANLSLSDKYKFALYSLLDAGIHFLSGEYISSLSFQYMILRKREFIKHKMGKLGLISYLLKDQKAIKKHGNDTCVVDYIWDQVKGKRGFKKYDYKRLKTELYEYVDHSKTQMVNTYELIKWVESCHPNISVHAFDSRYRKFVSHIAKNECRISLVYIVKDHHLWPITDKRLKTAASEANQGGCNYLLKHMVEFKWDTRHENITKLNNIDEIQSINEDNKIIILPKDIKMSSAISVYTKKSNYYIEYMHWDNNGVLDGFIDVNSNLYVLNNEYDKRKSICDKLFDIYKSDDFRWSNQSFTSIASFLHKQINGYIIESSYDYKTRQILDEYYPRALQWVTKDEIKDEDIPNLVSIDISKCYPSVLLNNTSPIPIYTIHDHIEEFNSEDKLNDNGEYYIDEFILKYFNDDIKIESGFYSKDLIIYLIDNFNMPKSQIKYKIVSKKALKPDTFKGYIEYMFNNFNEQEAKLMTNAFIGNLGRKYSKINHGFISSDIDTALCCWTSSLNERRNITISNYDDIYLIKETKIERLFSDHTSINRYVISGAILKCLKLLYKCYDDESKIISINTDGFIIQNPRVLFKHKKDVKFDIKCIGKPFVTDSEFSYFEKKYRDNIDITQYDDVLGDGFIFKGKAGCGKTSLLCNMVIKENKPLILSYTNKSIQNVKSRLIKNDVDINKVNRISHTFDSYFCEWNQRDMSSLEGKTIFVDEFSMVPNKWITLLYQAFLKYNIKVYLFGDNNQCSPVENGSQISYNYVKSHAIRHMCPNIETLEYIKDCARYDKQAYIMLNKFLKNGKISHQFKKTDKTLMKNICYLNKTRIDINTQCCEIFCKDKQYYKVNFKYNNKKETYKVSKNMPIIATTNLKEHDVYNTMEFKIDDIKEENKTILYSINDIWFTQKNLEDNFIPSFCVTVYKYQGASINEPYNIFDTHLMDKKQLYTALSRTTKLEYIRLNNNELNSVYKIRKQPDIELINSRFNSLYKNGKIYLVSFNNDKKYIGSTCEDLHIRLKWHLKSKNSQVYKFKNYAPKIELLVNSPCDSKRSLEEVENKYIDYYAKMYNDQLINIRMNPNKRKIKEIKYKVQVDNEKELRARIAQLESKIKIKDNTKDKYIFYDCNINKKRYRTIAKYNKNSREDATEKINQEKQKLINRLVIDF